MADDKYTFEAARIRLEEIAVEVRKKDTSLEKSLDLLEEGVRLANICTELVDHTDVGATVTAPVPEGEEPEAAGAPNAAGEPAAASDEAAEAGADDDDAAEAEADVADDADAADAADGFDEADDAVDEPSDAGIED